MKIKPSQFFSYSKISWEEKKYFWEALFYMFFYQFVIKTIPMKKYIKHVGEINKPLKTDCPEINKHILYKVSQAIVRVQNIINIENRCYPEALTAKRMLKKRGIFTTLFIGIRRENNKVFAHAWLKCGGAFVVGKRDMEKYAVVTTIS